jgi:hypothetical protein
VPQGGEGRLAWHRILTRPTASRQLDPQPDTQDPLTCSSEG